MDYRLTYNQLLFDLYLAYYDARKGKADKEYVRAFEEDLKGNMRSLCDELWHGTYSPLPSDCFIVYDPHIREIFAAQFRDRIVHHLYYNYTHRMFERTYIYDCYSCVPGRGTHFGIQRLAHHIRQVSENWSKPCLILKMDIEGYFCNINRNLLLYIVLDSLDKMGSHYVSGKSGPRWREIIDIPFVTYLTEVIVLSDPTEDCNIIGSILEWGNLPERKSLFGGDPDDGLPIGNLPSQMYSNVFMGVLDNYLKRQLHRHHYGRYVDDSFDVDNNAKVLKEVLRIAKNFAGDKLGLSLNDSKCRIADARHGVEFLGAFIKPHRIYISRNSWKRVAEHTFALSNKVRSGLMKGKMVSDRVNSALGVLSHYSCYRMKQQLFLEDELTEPLRAVGVFNRTLTRYAAA